jgi:PEGA domain
VVVQAHRAAAQPPNDAAQEASQHFRHGVELYNETDYAGALVEFKRAYALAESSAALFNIGESQYQLQDYAGALTTFQHFLAASGPSDGHRAEVESNVQALRTRVAHLRITTQPQGADIAIDDQVVGRTLTPVGKTVLVSVGHRKLVASMAGRPPVTTYVDVAAGDDFAVTLSLLAPGEVTQAKPDAEQRPFASSVESAPSAPRTLRTVGWIATGTLAGAAATFGVLALGESRDLQSARNRFPGSTGTLNHIANLTITYSIVADSLAAVVIAVGGLSLYWTLSSPSSVRGGDDRKARLTLGPNSAHFQVTF